MKSIGPILYGVATALFVSFLFGVSATVGGEKPGAPGLILGAVMGFLVWLIMNTIATNRKTAPVDDAFRQRALAFETLPRQAALYLLRSGVMGKAASMTLALDGREIAQLRSPQFTRLDIEPGQHILTASFGPQPVDFTFTAHSEEAVVLRLTIGFGARRAPVQIERVSVESARHTLRNVAMVEANAPAIHFPDAT
ncbi:MAG: hypothetical protein WDM79_14315 [Terricaulis sp.]